MDKIYKTRYLESQVKMLRRNFPVVVVGGARQVGKSTLLSHLFPQFKRVVFDPLVDIAAAKTDPELFLKNNPTPIILDEIQYVPSLVPAIKRALENNRNNGQYLMTGSQQWEVLKNLQESLAGRVAFLDLYPFTHAEVLATNANPNNNLWLKGILEQGLTFIPNLSYQSNQFSLYEQLWRGYYPEAQFIETAAIPFFFRGYERTYIERDIRLMLESNQMDVFVRFYRLCAALSAQEINYSQLGRELGLSPDTSKRWLALLKATYQWLEIPAYSGNTIKRLSKKPKGYIVDSGLICHALGISSPDILANHPNWGAIFETVVVLDIIKQRQLFAYPPNLFHYRTMAKAEVDLVIEYQGKYFLIEVKGKTHPNKKDISGILSFIETFPQLPIELGLIISAGSDSYALADKIWTIPFESVVI